MLASISTFITSIIPRGSNPACCHVAKPFAVGLRFILPAELQLRHLIYHVRDHRGGVTALTITRSDRHRRDEHLAELSLLHLLRRMPLDDVARFVTEHAGQFGFVFQLSIEPARDEDLPPGNAKALIVFGSASR